jgi:hypothetical protein
MTDYPAMKSYLKEKHLSIYLLSKIPKAYKGQRKIFLTASGTLATTTSMTATRTAPDGQAHIDPSLYYALP